MRIIDSPGLFGVGVGGGTIGKIICEWCNKLYNQDNEDENGEPIDINIPSVGFLTFAGKQICDCCYEKIENAMFYRADDFLDWLKKIEYERKKKSIGRLKKIEEIKRTTSPPGIRGIRRGDDAFSERK